MVKHTKEFWEEHPLAARLKEAKEAKRLQLISDGVLPKRDARGRLLPGYSANPKGMAPNTPRLGWALRKRLEKHPEEADKVIEVVIKLALMGDMRAIELLWDRLDGKVIEEHLIKGEMPVTIQFIPAQRLLDSKPIEIELMPQLGVGKEEKQNDLGRAP